MQRIIEDRNPDIIQTHNIKSHFLVRLLGLYKRRAWIAFHHGYTCTDLKVRAYNQLDRWSLRKANRLVAVCGPFADQLVRAGLKRDRIMVRHNMIQPYARPPERELDGLRQRLHIGVDEQVILSVGRLSREKGHLDLVNAIGILGSAQSLDKVRVLIAGDGPDRSSIAKRSGELNLDGIVELVGHQPDIRAWYALADVMALPSHSEGSPNVLLEALAAGVPTVATSVGGVPEIVSDNVSALLVPRGDCDRMARSIALLLNDGKLRARLRKQGLNAIERFTPEAYCESILGVYRQVSQPGNALRIMQ